MQKPTPAKLSSLFDDHSDASAMTTPRTSVMQTPLRSTGRTPLKSPHHTPLRSPYRNRISRGAQKLKNFLKPILASSISQKITGFVALIAMWRLLCFTWNLFPETEKEPTGVWNRASLSSYDTVDPELQWLFNQSIIVRNDILETSWKRGMTVSELVEILKKSDVRADAEGKTEWNEEKVVLLMQFVRDFRIYNGTIYATLSEMLEITICLLIIGYFYLVNCFVKE